MCTLSYRSKQFFTCTEPNSASADARWYKGLKKNIWRTLFQRAVKAGEALDKSNVPIFLEHVKKICGHFAKTASSESEELQHALRKFVIKSLHMAAGRTAEISWLHLLGLKWCVHFQCVFCEIPQTKTSKVKIIAFVAGNDRHACWFLDLADYLATGALRAGLERTRSEQDYVMWLFPALRKQNPGKIALV